MFTDTRKLKVPAPGEALPGRAEKMPLPERHFVLGTPLEPPFPAGTELAVFGMGCFWGAEKLFWTLPGVISTAVGYAGGPTPNPTYREVCSGRTGHTEVVQVAFDARQISYDDLLKTFWESHDPTQGMRQGNDVGTQYRSAIYWHGEEQRDAAEASRRAYEAALAAAGRRLLYLQIQPRLLHFNPVAIRAACQQRLNVFDKVDLLRGGRGQLFLGRFIAENGAWQGSSQCRQHNRH